MVKQLCEKQVDDPQFHLMRQSPPENATDQSLREYIAKLENNKLVCAMLPDMVYVNENRLYQWNNGHYLITLRERYILDIQLASLLHHILCFEICTIFQTDNILLYLIQFKKGLAHKPPDVSGSPTVEVSFHCPFPPAIKLCGVKHKVTPQTSNTHLHYTSCLYIQGLGNK